MSGIKGRSGRKAGWDTTIKRYLESNKHRIPEILGEITIMAMGRHETLLTCPHCKGEFTHHLRGSGNFDALKWLAEYHLGKPRQSLDVTARRDDITGDDFKAIALDVLKEQTLALGSTIDGDATEVD